MKGQRQMNQILMRLALYIPVLGLGMGILFADSSPAATAYTLKDLCRLAARDAEQIQISREDVEIARQDRTRALSVLIPRATAFGSMKRSRESDFYSPDTLSHGIQLNQSFTLNGKEIIALKVAEATIEEKNFILKAVTDAYLFNVIDSFFRILTSRRMLEIARADVRRLEKHRNAVSKKLKVGEITKTALYRAEAELSGAGTDLVRAENGLKLARASLKSLVTLDRDFTLSQEGLEAFRRFLPSLEDVKDKALNQRPEIQSARKTLEIARKNIRYNKSAYWPSVALEGLYSKNRAEYSMPVDEVLNFETTSIAATLNFTLFVGGPDVIGAMKLGALTIWAGTIPSERLLAIFQTWRPTVTWTTPSYAWFLGESAKENGINPADLSIRKIFVAGEPGGSIPETKQSIEELWNADVYDYYGLSDIFGACAGQCEYKQGLHWAEDHILVEVVDPDTGEEVPEGERGEMILTSLKKVARPLIRFRTGDIVSYTTEPCACGRTHMRLNGIHGRLDDMLIIKGVNVFPSDIETVVRQNDKLTGEYLCVVTEERHMAVLTVEVEKNMQRIRARIRGG